MPDPDLALLAFDAAPVGIVLTEDRVIQACNRMFCQITGYDRPELIGQSFRKLYISTSEFERVRDIGLSKLTEGKDYSDLRLIRHREGAAVWCRFRAQTLDAKRPLARAVLTYAKLGNMPAGTDLTARERDVVMGLGNGETSKEIAARLGLSPRSVEDVRARLLKKFSAKSAAEMLMKFTNVEV